MLRKTLELLQEHTEDAEYWRCHKLFKHYEKEITAYPASIRYHHTEQGGYIRHILEVMQYVIQLEYPQLVRLAFLHDVDKLERYQIDTEKPTAPQLKYAKSLGIMIEPIDSKTSISVKINNTKNNLNDPIQYFTYRDFIPMDESANVIRICSNFDIKFSIEDVHCLCCHHGGWSHAGTRGELSPLATVLHCADLMSSNINGKDLL